jgi:hypothetical protein
LRSEPIACFTSDSGDGATNCERGTTRIERGTTRIERGTTRIERGTTRDHGRSQRRTQRPD